MFVCLSPFHEGRQGVSGEGGEEQEKTFISFQQGQKGAVPTRGVGKTEG